MSSDSQSNNSSSDDLHTSFAESDSDASNSGNESPQIDWSILSQNVTTAPVIEKPKHKTKNSPSNVLSV